MLSNAALCEVRRILRKYKKINSDVMVIVLRGGVIKPSRRLSIRPWRWPSIVVFVVLGVKFEVPPSKATDEHPSNNK